MKAQIIIYAGGAKFEGVIAEHTEKEIKSLRDFTERCMKGKVESFAFPSIDRSSSYYLGKNTLANSIIEIKTYDS